MKLTVELTEKQEELLKMFATDHYPNSDKNCGTHHPLFVVETRRERVIDPEYDSIDTISYYVYEWGIGYDDVDEMLEHYWEDEECPIHIKPFDDVYNETIIGVDKEEHYIADEEDYLKAYGFNLGYSIGYMQYYYDPVAYFFIREEAEKYMEYQSHNLTAPRVYAVGAGYANYGDYHPFYELLMSIGIQLKEGEVVEEANN